MLQDNETFSSFYLYKEHKQLFLSNPINIYVQYKNYRYNLLSGKKEQAPLAQFVKDIEKYKVSDQFEKPIVIHLYYEFGFYCTDQIDLIEDSEPLALFIEYKSFEKKEIYNFKLRDKLEIENVSFTKKKDYKVKFDFVYQNLLKGNCYQVNLTTPFFFRINCNLSPKEIIHQCWTDPLKIGAYAHATYINALDKFILSNTPECLYQVHQNQNMYKVTSLPIKGTLKVDNEAQRDAKWSELIKSSKNQAELYMITDLIRNDLSKIDLKKSNVIKKKSPLNVPGLIHQFSIIETEVSAQTNFAKIIKCLFPGGSITGAPKKRVMQLIKEIEGHKRSIYCGSTLLFFKNVKTASINIRTAEINFTQDELIYGSGGGITLESEPEEEYEEMLGKLKSFLTILSP